MTPQRAFIAGCISSALVFAGLIDAWGGPRMMLLVSAEGKAEI